MNVLKEKIDYFQEKKGEIKKIEMELKMKAGKLDEEFSEWLKELGVPDGSHLVDVIEKVSQLK